MEFLVVRGGPRREEAGVAWGEGQRDHEGTGYVWGLRHSGPECESCFLLVLFSGSQSRRSTRLCAREMEPYFQNWNAMK